MPFKAVWSNQTPADPCTVTIAPDANDFLIAYYVNDANTVNDFAPPSGWTEACELQNNTDNQCFVVWYKKADGTETSISFDANSGNTGIAAVLSFSGIDTTTQLDVTPVTFNNNTSATTSDISITPTTNGCDIVFVAGNDRTSSGNTTFTFSTQSGSTGSWITESDINSGFMNGAAGVASQTTAGAITVRCTTDTAGGRSGIVFALRPAVGAFDIDQEGFRFGIDDAAESSHTWSQAQDTNDTVSVGTARLIRTLLNATGDPATLPLALRYQKNGAGGYAVVPVGANTSPVLSYGDAGSYAYSANGGTTVSPAYPAGITTNSALVLVIGQKPSSANGGTATTPTGWTLQASLTGANDGDTGGYTTTLGADTGNCNIFVYTKDSVTGSESGTLSVTIGTNNVAWGIIIRIQSSDRVGAWSWSCGVGKDTSAGNVSIATGSMSIAAGDFMIAGMVIPTDVTTPSQFSAQALSQSGTTFGTVTEIAEADSATGNDIGGFIVEATVSSGSGSGAATLTATAGGTTTNVRGPGFVLRGRASSAANEIYVTPSANIASGGEATTARLTAPSGKTLSDFTAGRRWDDENGTDSVDIASGFYTEVEWSVTTQSPAANGDYFDFRVYASTVPMTTYSVTPRLTMGAGGGTVCNPMTGIGGAAAKPLAA